MKRFRLRMSTLMLLVVIVALSFALVTQERRHRRREAELQTRIEKESMIHGLLDQILNQMALKVQAKELQAKLGRSAGGAGGVNDGK